MIKKICLSSFSVKIIRADGVSYPIVLALGRSAKNTQEKIRIFSPNPYRTSITTGLVIFLLTSSACIKASCLLL
ncbi:hypothetical protein EXS94_01640 [Helicobacter pylori]|nr:hypothetical protein [Helicobacter pylori]NHB28700.1 hypothetical protein [Helicobacter pylori]